MGAIQLLRSHLGGEGCPSKSEYMPTGAGVSQQCERPQINFFN